MDSKSFLLKFAETFVSDHPSWRVLRSSPGERYLLLSREIDGGPALFLDFVGEPRSSVLDQGVGWGPSEAALLSQLDKRENEPIRAREGGLRKVLAAGDNARDFQHEQMRISTSSLVRAFGGFDLEEGEQPVREQIVSEISQAAFPYLSQMLRVRHGIALPSTEL